MNRYLFIARYDSTGAQGVLAKAAGPGRARSRRRSPTSVGDGDLRLAFGKDDVYTLCELPDNQAAASVALR